jgi:hypothetical protein
MGNVFLGNWACLSTNYFVMFAMAGKHLCSVNPQLATFLDTRLRGYDEKIEGPNNN